MSAVFLSQGRKCAFGCGCTVTPMAERVAICISTAESNFSHRAGTCCHKRGGGQRGTEDISPPPGTSQSLRLAHEGLHLNILRLPQEVINNIQSRRAPSVRSLYDLKWHGFEDWCTHKGVIPFQCVVSDMPCFLQSLMNSGRAFSTIKVYLAAILACHVGFEGVSVGWHPHICRFMKGEKRLRPVSKWLVPSWDLSMVLNALNLESVHIKLLYL